MRLGAWTTLVLLRSVSRLDKIVVFLLVQLALCLVRLLCVFTHVLLSMWHMFVLYVILMLGL